MNSALLTTKHFIIRLEVRTDLDVWKLLRESLEGGEQHFPSWNERAWHYVAPGLASLTEQLAEQGRSDSSLPEPNPDASHQDPDVLAIGLILHPAPSLAIA